MSTDLVLPNNFGPVSTMFAGRAVDENLGAGITGGFAVISYRGKVWAIRTGGAEVPLMRADGDGPRSSIEVVILKASPFISKVYYKSGYTPGQNDEPDCFSNNGATPDPSVAQPQAPACAICPMNAWGSRVNQQTGKQGKACADSKRLAVMPLDDLQNKSKLGPMLLRVPPASLQDTSRYANNIKGWGYDYFTVGTRIAFDTVDAFPKFVYTAIRPVTDEEAELVLKWRDSVDVENILSTAEKPAAPATANAPQFEQAQHNTPAQPTPSMVSDTVAAQVAALQAQLAAAQAPKVTQPVTPAAPVETPEQARMRELQAQIAAMTAAQTVQAPPPPPPPAPPAKTPEELQMEALTKQLADLQAAKAKEAAEAAAKEEEKARKKAEREAKKAAEAATKAAAEEALKSSTPIVSASVGGRAPTMEELMAQLAALQGGQGGAAAGATQAPLTGEVLPPVTQPAPAAAAPQATGAELSHAAIEARLAQLLGKTA